MANDCCLANIITRLSPLRLLFLIQLMPTCKILMALWFAIQNQLMSMCEILMVFVVGSLKPVDVNMCKKLMALW